MVHEPIMNERRTNEIRFNQINFSNSQHSPPLSFIFIPSRLTIILLNVFQFSPIPQMAEEEWITGPAGLLV